MAHIYMVSRHSPKHYYKYEIFKVLYELEANSLEV